MDTETRQSITGCVLICGGAPVAQQNNLKLPPQQLRQSILQQARAAEKYFRADNSWPS